MTPPTPTESGLYSLRPDVLRDPYDWAALFRGFWTERIDVQAFLSRQTPINRDSDDEF